MRGSCALAQDGMGLLGDVFDLHARHGAIMALEAPVRKRAVLVCEAAFFCAGGAYVSRVILQPRLAQVAGSPGAIGKYDAELRVSP